MTRKQRAIYTRKQFEKAAYIAFNGSWNLGMTSKSRRSIRDMLLQEAKWQESRILEGKV